MTKQRLKWFTAFGGRTCYVGQSSFRLAKDLHMTVVPQLISRWLGTDRVADFAERVAGRSRLAVWQRVLQRLPTLGPTEARGYLRARAVAVVREETDRLIEQEGTWAARHRQPIEETALHTLTQVILAQLDQRRLQAGTRQAA